MKRWLICLIILVVLAGSLWAQEADDPPRGAASIVLATSWAPFGIGGELFLGNMGLGVTLGTLFIGVEDVFVYVLEPGAYGRFYFSDVDSSMFLVGGVTYLFGGAISGGDAEVLDNLGALKFYAGFGYNALFGKKNNTRFSVEIGPRYKLYVVEGETNEALLPILPYCQIMFGGAF